MSQSLERVGQFLENRLTKTAGRQRFYFSPPELKDCANLDGYLRSNVDKYVLFEVAQGLPTSRQTLLAEGVLANGQAAFFHRVKEETIERLDFYILARYRKAIFFTKAYGLLAGGEKSRRLLAEQSIVPTPAESGDQASSAGGRSIDELLQQCNSAIDTLLETAAPIPMEVEPDGPSEGHAISGLGCYMRFDFWVNISSGGSYGHTCYVAKELADVTERFVFIAANRYGLIDDLGLKQIVLDDHPGDGNDENILRANFNYYPQLREQFLKENPAYIYERISLGNFLSLRLSQEFGIPYIVEYNGSEISMMRSFGGGAYLHEDFYLKVEEAIFKQATLISVVSEPIKDDLVQRGIDPGKILVNPNGCDPNVYFPIPEDEKQSIRREQGFKANDCVIGFTGTFGGWHGMDILAEALPDICSRAPNARFLLIGDGAYREVVENTIVKHKLKPKVRLAGRVPQDEGARLLGACDIFISPHSSHMVDSPFFGSPTKIFEYMSMGGAIVASDLEQIGIVLSPALHVEDLNASNCEAGDARAVLCVPGSANSFADAVVKLVAHPNLHAPLGRNARMAIIDFYSWKRHVERLLSFLRDDRIPEIFAQEFGVADSAVVGANGVDVGPDRARPHSLVDAATTASAKFVHAEPLHTLAWYDEAEAHRYNQIATWLPEVLSFERYAGKNVLQISAGLGIDLAQFAKFGATVTDLEPSAEAIELAQEHFRLRGLDGTFFRDAGTEWPIEDSSVDLVYCDLPLNDGRPLKHFVSQACRVLQPDGEVIATFLAERSLNFWRDMVLNHGIRHSMLQDFSLDEILLRKSDVTRSSATPQARIFTRSELRRAFGKFRDVKILQRQLRWSELPRRLKWFPLDLAERLVGSRLIVKARGVRER